MQSKAVIGRRLLAFGAVLIAIWPAATSATGPVPTSGYDVKGWASGKTSGCAAAGNQGTPTCYYNPDSITHGGSSVYVGYQNSAAADGSSGSSEVVQYDSVTAAVLAYYHVQGKNDGLRVDPSTGDLWALSNEDANPLLTIIHPGTASGTPTVFRLDTNSKFAGGYDDIAFMAQGVFISASNPGLNRQGTNNYRTIVQLHFDGQGQPVLTPILSGTPTGTDRSTGQTVTANLTDPDSLSVSPAGELVLNDQGDSTIAFVANPGTPAQSVSFLFLQPTSNAPIVDEVTWTASASGHFLVADHGRPGVVYRVARSGGFVRGTAYTTVAPDNPSASQAQTLAVLDTRSGGSSPVVFGFGSPKGLEFIG